MNLEAMHQLRDEALRLAVTVSTATKESVEPTTGSHEGAIVTLDGIGRVTDVSIDSSWRHAGDSGALAGSVLLAYRDAATSRIQKVLKRVDEASARASLSERLKAANQIPEPPHPSPEAAEAAMMRVRELGGIRAATREMIASLTEAGRETFEGRKAEGKIVAFANRQGEVTRLYVDSEWIRQLTDRSIAQQVAEAMRGAQDEAAAAPSLDDLMWKTPLGRSFAVLTDKKPG